MRSMLHPCIACNGCLTTKLALYIRFVWRYPSSLLLQRILMSFFAGSMSNDVQMECQFSGAEFVGYIQFKEQRYALKLLQWSGVPFLGESATS